MKLKILIPISLAGLEKALGEYGGDISFVLNKL